MTTKSRWDKPQIDEVLGYKVFNGNLGSCIDKIFTHLMKKDACHWLACINPHSFVIAQKDNQFQSALHQAHWLIPDGVGIVIASRLMGGIIKSRITGSDIFFALNCRMNKEGEFGVFFLGSTETCLKEINARMTKDYPNIRFSGCYSPSFNTEFSDLEIEEMISKINQANADVLWVGMTAPKQEKWIFQNLSRLDVKFAAGIGATFDFYAGKISRPYPFLQKAGLEWLARLVQEPRRLWKRNFVSSPIFLFRLLKWKFFSQGKN